MEKNMTRLEEELRYNLARFTCKVVFEKKDKTIRTMLCHRIMAQIPEAQHPKGDKQPTPFNIPVYDIEKNEWRSFNVASVIEWSIA
jgi:hypothetical protein